MQKQKPKARVNHFLKSIKESQPVVFCVHCGGTRLDQNFINELRCYDCGNVSEWDGRRFSIARNHDVRDVAQAVNRWEF